ncbi:ATR-interacting protein mus304-like [Rhagoletis pomonella]|uniref:ATR-interacting protein mus304-like n=1 Tax=Rhagoletis pomonella TaxID=28610 RepID=UPI0017850D3C|nr:ATR-interacting protein mus304-like [Rhagoletis pomonella]
MAKRFQPFKEFGRSTKKPKLDVSINKGRPLGPSQSWPNHLRPNAVEVARVDSPVGCGSNNNNLWDDDDDDVILLATQVAESQVAIKSASAVNISESDITFSEFAPHVHATTSTQRITTTTCAAVKATVSAPPTTVDKNNHSELFLDDDDDLVELLDAATNGQKPENTSGARQNQEVESVFKKPTQVLSGINGVSKRMSMGSTQAPAIDGQSAAVRRQVATERQVKMLTERLDALKAENAKLAKDLSESKGKIESKDGESSLLRDELRHMKQQLQTLKMEKIMSAEAAKTECKTKIAELARRVEAKESELKLRNVEYSVLKMRHADETQRLEMSIRNANVTGDVPMEEGVENPQEICNVRFLCRLRNLSLTTPQRALLNSQLTEMNASAYERPRERGDTKRQQTPFQQELANAQTLLAQLQLQQQKRSWTTAEAMDFNERAIASACNALPEFWTYVHGLEFPKHCNIHPYHDYDLRKDDQTFSARNLHVAQEFHADERAVSLRRYVAALSVMCAQAPNFAQQLLKQEHGDYALLQVACHAISKLGYSSEICAHFGALEAFATLLRVLLRQMRADSEDHFELLVGGLLKQLIFVRPSAWIFQEISYSVLELTRLPAALALLCVNSDESTFYSDRMRSLYRFSNDSCILQVYAGLLEIAFPLNGVLSEAHLRLLAVICENHVRFAHHCFMKPPDFIYKLLPSYDDDDDDDDDDDAEDGTENEQRMDTTEEQTNKQQARVPTESVDSATIANDLAATANSSAVAQEVAAQPTKHSSIKGRARCECYTKLCLSVVTLLFQLMRQWQCNGRKIETLRVAEISQISVQLLHTIFCDNYSTHLFRYAEETTKHYLWLICECWSENAKCLKFNSVQMNFLDKLRAFHIMPKQLNEEGNVANVINDLKEWHSLTNDNSTCGVTADPNAMVNLPFAAEKLDIMRCAVDESKFFEGLNGYAFNFE